MRQTSILEVNEFLVLDYVRAQGATSRPAIVGALDLSPSSVSRIIRRLIEAGLVTEGQRTSTGGRPRTAITFNSLAGCVLGVDLGGTKCHGAVADLSGNTLSEVLRPTGQESDPFPTLVAVIDDLSQRAVALGLPVAAIAVGAPAIIDPDLGVAVGGPNVHWHGFPLVAELGKHVGMPFTVQNDVNLAALAHSWRGDGRHCADFSVLSIGTGIGAAIVVNGRLAQGRHMAAGEVGYLVLARDQLSEGGARTLGAFERVAAGPAIAARAMELLAEGGPDSSLADAPVTSQAVFLAASAGDLVAGRVIEELLDHVAMAIVAIAAVADPEVVVLEGAVGRALEPFLPGLVKRIVPQLPTPPRVVTSTLGPNATVLGAVAAALQLARRRSAPAGFSAAFHVTSTRPSEGARLDVA